jgi:hypothetical protein
VRLSSRPAPQAGRGFLLILLCCALTAGCTPGHISVTAVFLDDGHPTAVVHPCRGTRVHGIAVVEEMTASASATSPTLGGVWAFADVDGDHPMTQIRLLETPPDWVLQTTKPGSLLTTFAVDRVYSVWADTTDARTDAQVEFTLSDLRSLRDDQVWATPEPLAQPRAMTRKEFRRHAAASC